MAASVRWLSDVYWGAEEAARAHQLLSEENEDKDAEDVPEREGARCPGGGGVGVYLVAPDLMLAASRGRSEACGSASLRHWDGKSCRDRRQNPARDAVGPA